MGAILLVASSILLYQSKTFIENDKVWKLKLYLSGALLSGLLFIFLQYEGWKQIYKSSVVSDIKIIMVMVSVHVIHFIGALVMLLTLFIPLFKIKTRADSFIYFLNDKRVAAFNSNRSYWDFLGILWIIIYSIIIWKSM
jgi:cytochrome c oxidase subunit 3